MYLKFDLPIPIGARLCLYLERNVYLGRKKIDLWSKCLKHDTLMAFLLTVERMYMIMMVISRINMLFKQYLKNQLC